MAESPRWRLCVMMFLQYVIWGSWLPLLALYLSQFRHFSGSEIGWIFATQAIASVTAVFVSGQIADRYISAERFLAVSHVIGGLAMFALALQQTFWPFLVTMQVYMLVYLPTLSLTNSIAFHHLKDAPKEFGPVRLWGTIGWIAASWPFVFLLRGKQGGNLESALTGIFVVAGAGSMALAAFSFLLPPTPPRRGVAERNAPFEAIYRKRPAEDFARATIRYVDDAGLPLIVEATTSWSFVGAGLRLSMELLGPEYSMSANTLDTGAKVFLSRRLRGEAGEDLVEKQNAEQGLMPVLGDEAGEYGYTAENRHFVRCFLDGVQPEEDFTAGLEVTELLMTAYMSAEQERSIDWKPAGLERYVPPVARGDWKK